MDLNKECGGVGRMTFIRVSRKQPAAQETSRGLLRFRRRWASSDAATIRREFYQLFCDYLVPPAFFKPSVV